MSLAAKVFKSVILLEAQIIIYVNNFNPLCMSSVSLKNIDKNLLLSFVQKNSFYNNHSRIYD